MLTCHRAIKKRQSKHWEMRLRQTPKMRLKLHKFLHCSYSRCGDDRKRIKGSQKVLKIKGLGGAPGKTRTCDLLIRSQTLYPTELRAHNLESILYRCEKIPQPQFCLRRPKLQTDSPATKYLILPEDVEIPMKCRAPWIAASADAFVAKSPRTMQVG